MALFISGDNQLKWLLAKLFFLFSVLFCCCCFCCQRVAATVKWLIFVVVLILNILKRLFHYEFISLFILLPPFLVSQATLDSMMWCRLKCCAIWYVNWALDRFRVLTQQQSISNQFIAQKLCRSKSKWIFNYFFSFHDKKFVNLWLINLWFRLQSWEEEKLKLRINFSELLEKR